MASMPFTLTFDNTGFPMIRYKEWDFFISVFPVSKYQFERFLVETMPEGELFSDGWYRNLLARNPRCGWHSFRDEPWRLFLSCLDDDVMKRFTRFCGRGCRLPEAAEWRKLMDYSGRILEQQAKLLELCAEAPAPVRHWLKQGLFPLTEEGMLEYVLDNGKMRAIGKPFYGFHPTLWRPDVVRDVDQESGLGALLGFRLAMSSG